MDVITTNASNQPFLESPQHLRIQTPVVKCFGDRKRIVRAVAGLETAIHEFGLPFHKRKAAFSMRAFPLVKKVCAVNLSSGIRASLVRPEGSGNARQDGLCVARIKRIFEAWNPDEILQTARLTIGRYAIEKYSIVTMIPK